MLFVVAALMFVDNIYGQIAQIVIWIISMIFYIKSEKEVILRIYSGVKKVVQNRKGID